MLPQPKTANTDSENNQKATTDLKPKSLDTFKSNEDQKNYNEQAPFLPTKPISQSPKISPSSIPNPSPSVKATKQEHGYPNYGGYLYSIPGYSAFQPVAYQGVNPPTVQNNQPIQEPPSRVHEFVPISTTDKDTDKKQGTTSDVVMNVEGFGRKVEDTKQQTDFEENFTPEIIPAAAETKKQTVESKMSITTLSQSSDSIKPAADLRKKTPERFSLKTSIPISKIDMKCVNTPPDTSFHNNMNKKLSTTFSFPFQTIKTNELPARVEIQSNVVIKTAPLKDTEVKSMETNAVNTMSAPNNSISTLINAAESIKNNDSKIWKAEPPVETKTQDSVKDTVEPSTTVPQPVINPIASESKLPFANKPPDQAYNEQKNQIVFIQNKSPANRKMLLAISSQQNNPQVLLQRTNYDSKNLLAPSRLSSLNKKSNDSVSGNGTSSKVVALKRLHHENCDENDFENLITENQIYGNKIVVKEKSQGSQQELKKNIAAKIINDKINNIGDTKNVVLQPNFLYLSNLQFPANLMMIKNTTKLNSNFSDHVKITNKSDNIFGGDINSNEQGDNSMALKLNNTQSIETSKESNILKSSNHIVPLVSHQQGSKTTDLLLQSNQKVLMKPQILYKVPMLVDKEVKPNANQKSNSPKINNEDYSKFQTKNKLEDIVNNEQSTNSKDKIFIACPYQMDAKLKTNKIVITSIGSQTPKEEDISTLDIYEKRKRLRRLKHLTNKEKEHKVDVKKEKLEICASIITPDNVKAEIYKEFAKTKIIFEDDCSDSESYYDDDMKEHADIIEQHRMETAEQNATKINFLSNFKLSTLDVCKEKQLQKAERSLQKDRVAAAYIAVGRIDKISPEPCQNGPDYVFKEDPVLKEEPYDFQDIKQEKIAVSQKKSTFLAQLCLVTVSSHFKEVYEKTWQEIVKERRRRNGIKEPIIKKRKIKQEKIDQSTIDQLQILTDIQNSVTENNNLIKQRLDSTGEINANDNSSIYDLAEKNFSELSKLSKMADRSVKLFSRKETRKRDLTPGFDSENIKRSSPIHQPFTPITIPNLSKIISLKSSQDMSMLSTTPATSMDEPQNSAAGAETKDEIMVVETKVNDDFKAFDTVQMEEKVLPWPGMEAVLQSYKNHNMIRNQEIARLHRRNTQLRVDCANANRTSAREADIARILLAEQRTLANDDANVRASIQRLLSAVEVVRNYAYY